MSQAREGLVPKKMGRKPLEPGQAKAARFEMRCQPEVMDSWRRAADAAGQSLTEWLTQAGNERLRR